MLRLEKTTPRGVGRSAFTVADRELIYETASRLDGDAGFRPVMRGRYRRIGPPQDTRALALG